LQAETESELKDWITAFENAKRHAFRSSNDLSSSAAAAVINHKEVEDEQNVSNTDEGEHNSNKSSATNSVEGYKINGNSTSQDLKNTPPLASTSPPSSLETKRNNSNSLTKRRATSVSNSPTSRPSIPTHNSFGVSSKTSTPNSINSTVSVSSSVQSSPNDKPSSSANQQNFWGSLQWAMPAMNLIMNTGNTQEDEGAIEDGTGSGRPRSGSGPVGSGADGSIAEYPHNLLLHNAQLHLLFPCATEAEYVLDSKY